MPLIRDTRDLGAYIRRIRKARGYTQARLAEIAGVGVVYISQLENGKETAEIGKALNLLQLLSVDLEAIDRRNPTERDTSPAPIQSRYADGQPALPDSQALLSPIPADVKDTYLAFPSLLGEDGQTHVAPADQAFWYRIKRPRTPEPPGDDE